MFVSTVKQSVQYDSIATRVNWSTCSLNLRQLLAEAKLIILIEFNERNMRMKSPTQAAASWQSLLAIHQACIVSLATSLPCCIKCIELIFDRCLISTGDRVHIVPLLPANHHNNNVWALFSAPPATAPARQLLNLFSHA